MTTSLHKRLAYLALASLLVFLGLASRSYDHLLPNIIAIHIGDMLWAMMIYCGMRFLFASKSPLLAVFLSLSFCFIIEFSQLYQAEWINSIRETTIGALILGRGFLLVDLWRYTLGIAFAFLMDLILIKHLKP